jgi:LacI family gluconate utilization system Gnt-I transcriptional repressor
MEDVARAAGVSMITVSRALNTPEKLAPATLRAVRSAIERLRYVPNLTAGSLASNRSRIVGAIVPTVANSIFAETIDGLEQQLAEHGYQLLLGQTHYRPEEEAALVDAFLGRRVDGLMLTGVAPGRRARLRPRGTRRRDSTRRATDDMIGLLQPPPRGRVLPRGQSCRSLAFIGGVRPVEKRLADSEGARECGASWAARRCSSIALFGRRRPRALRNAGASRATSGVLQQRHACRGRAVRVRPRGSRFRHASR